MFKTVRARLTLWYILLLVLILSAFSGVLYFALAHELYQGMDNSFVLNVQGLVNGVSVSHGQMVLPGDQIDINDRNALRAQGYLVRILDTNGKVLDTNPTYAPLPITPDAVAMARRGLSHFETVFVNGEAYRLYTAPLRDEGRGVIGVFQLAEALGEVEEPLRQLVMALAIVVPLTLALATFCGIWFTRRVLMPVDQITRTVQRISSQDLSQRLNLNLANDEIGRLAHTFDAMLERLDDAFRRERDFTANASHELRTPLTVMRGEIDVALQRPRQLPEYVCVLSELRRDLEHLSRTAEDLLLLARADAQQLAVTCEELNAARLLQAVSDEARPLAEAQRITLEVQADPMLLFWGDEQKMLRILFNLVDNALKFSQPDTCVVLSATCKDNTVSLRVSDQGPGMSSDVLPHIFDRFYRSINGRVSGAGLGLAIVRALVQAQGGEITVESETGKSTTFTVAMKMKIF